ncbi:hypothetical protein STEG23_011327, partial [Scotinomys teguina]
ACVCMCAYDMTNVDEFIDSPPLLIFFPLLIITIGAALPIHLPRCVAVNSVSVIGRTLEPNVMVSLLYHSRCVDPWRIESIDI